MFELISYLIPKWDQWRSEFVQEADDLLRHLTGFTGSLGILIIQDDAQHLFVDPRYALQAAQECPSLQLHPYAEWKTFLKNTKRVIIDPWLWSEDELKDLPTVEYDDLMLRFWPDRPKHTNYAAVDYTHYVEDKASKIQKICDYLKEKQADALLITDNASLSWLLNIRSLDKPYSLAVEQFGVVYADGTTVCRPRENEDTFTFDTFMGPGFCGKTVIIDPNAPIALRTQFFNAIVSSNPIDMMKARKSPLEIEGFKNAHTQDGKALQEFFLWLENESHNVTEIQAEEQLLSYRKRQPDFITPSFQTISGAGPNGAIVHYRATSQTNRILKPGDIYLVDSGGHYYGGTTDVTRTVLYQSNIVPFEVKENFTLVLKGFLALATAVFPKGTTGANLDGLARQFLWRKQRNYGHGTGHGVGACLNVHEGPQNISPRGSAAPLLPGMVVSIEPGFYKTGAYGIRIENLVYVETLDDEWYHFQNLTCAPIDTRLIDATLLTTEEKRAVEHLFFSSVA